MTARAALALRVAACTGAIVATAAHAARPMITDDARVVDPGACQLETWAKRNADSTEYWALPACDPWGHVELTFGGGRTRAQGESHLTDNLVQAKTLVHALEPGSWGLALTVGTLRHPQRETASGWPGDAYVNVPVSFSTRDESWVAHVNAGASYRRDERRTLATWGFGNEVRLTSALYFIPEIFRSEFGRPFYQVGLRYWVVKDFVQLDATYGNRAVSDAQERWYSIGLRLISPPFMR